MARSQPCHIPTGDRFVFALHQRPDSIEAGRIPVLICSPWGWDEVASYRARREWGKRLVAAGHPTLRFDLPATGNSDGRTGDPELVEMWVGAITATATWLAGESDVTAVAALGLGLGGLLALESAARGAPIADLALWGAPARGRRFLRETRAFAALQLSNAGPEDFDPGVPEGWIEAGGFALSPETIASLSALAPKRAGGLKRVLAFERDGIAPDPELLATLSGEGAEVCSLPGPGWGKFVSHPERSVFPVATAESLRAWLAEPAGRETVAGPHPKPPSARIETVRLADRDVQEKVVALGEDWGETVGVASEPAGGGDGDLCAVFLNGGAVREIGPNRLWAETSRDWAEAGVTSFRIDLKGIGEADGEPSGSLRVSDYYQARFGNQVGAILDEIERRGLGRRFILVGLCAGGYWAFRSAVDDDRVIAVFGVNVGALRWHEDLLAHRAARLGGDRARKPAFWRKLLSGGIESRKVINLGGLLLRGALLGLREAVLRPFGRSRSQRLLSGIEDDFDRLAPRGTRLMLAFSAGEALGEEVEADGLTKQRERWPNIEFAQLPGSDHTLRPPITQRAAHRFLDEALRRVRTETAATEDPSAPQSVAGRSN